MIHLFRPVSLSLDEYFFKIKYDIYCQNHTKKKIHMYHRKMSQNVICVKENWCQKHFLKGGWEGGFDKVDGDER